MSIISAFDHVENKHTLYHGEDCMEKFCNSENMLQIYLILKRRKC